MAFAGGLDKLCSFYTKYTVWPHELKTIDKYPIIDYINIALVKY